MIECDYNCLECPYPEMPKQCENMPATPRERREISGRNSRRKWTPEQLERKRAKAREYYYNNKERCNANSLAWHRKNADFIRDLQRKRRYDNVKKYAAAGRRIRVERHRAGMSGRELAALLGVAKSTLHGYEAGYTRAPWDKLCRVFPALEEWRMDK